jgi:hypothetical protein
MRLGQTSLEERNQKTKHQVAAIQTRLPLPLPKAALEVSEEPTYCLEREFEGFNYGGEPSV